ncbi:MAG: hypothetical protein EBZ48_02920 [Proteobacteria bacterium]|nr:hypothetical protein [Pseudomonadota bacterium]
MNSRSSSTVALVVTGIFSGLLIISMMLPRAAEAQSGLDLPPQLQQMAVNQGDPNLTPEQLALMQSGKFNSVQLTIAGVLGIPPDSPELKIFAVGASVDFPKQRKQLSPTLLGHYVLTGGIPLPDPSAIKKPELSTEQRQLLESALSDALKEVDQLQQDSIARWGKPRPLQSCSTGTTQRYNYSEEGAGGDDSVIVDLLFLAKPPPLNSDELFGKNTTVIQYHSTGVDPLSAAISGAGVPCLPYRVRVLRAARFEHQGIDALANFDAAPMSRGKILPKLRSVLKGYE